MAAARKRTKPSSSTNPSTVLIVFLVFFILLSIGLGVWGYYGYQAAQKKEKAGLELKAKADADRLGMDYYKLQGLWAKAAAGHDLGKDEPNDLNTLYGDFFTAKKFDKEQTKAAVETMISEDKKELDWDDAAKKLKTSYREKIKKLKKRNEELQKERDTAVADYEKEKARENDRDKKNKKSWDDLKTEIKEYNDRAVAERKKAEAAATAANTSKDELRDTYDKEIKKQKAEFDDFKASNAKALKAKDEQIAQLTVKKELLEAKEARNAKTNLLEYEVPKGKIVRVDWTGKMPYINLGKADRLKEQLTFSIYGISSTGKVEKDPKGSLEIVKIIDDHLSQGRIIHLTDENAKPLQEGDRLYNPAWDPNRKIHVAIAGIVDFTGDESATVIDRVRNLREFINNLERQDIVVDAYLDLRDLTIKGSGLSVKTDYFILADGPKYDDSRILDLKEDKVKLNQETSKKMEEMRKDAVKKGVTLIPLHKFAVITGYRIPRITRMGDPSSYRTGAPVEKQPKEKKKKEGEDGEGDDKKMDDKKKDDEDKKDDKKMEEDDKKGDKKGDEDDKKPDEGDKKDGDKKNGDKKDGKKKDDEEKKKDDEGK
jgi:hypothetical protein